MREELVKKLHDYISENNPDLLVQLEEEGGLTTYLEDKVSAVQGIMELGKVSPAYITEEECMNILTSDLKPSRFHYIKSILEEEFETDYTRFRESGILKFEIINIINACKTIFDDCRFSDENEDDPFLKYCVTGAISEYLEWASTVE